MLMRPVSREVGRPSLPNGPEAEGQAAPGTGLGAGFLPQTSLPLSSTRWPLGPICLCTVSRPGWSQRSPVPFASDLGSAGAGAQGLAWGSPWELFSQSMCSWTVSHGGPGGSRVLVRRVPASHSETRKLQQARNRNQPHCQGQEHL